MSLDKPVHRIAIVGTGVIGASWSAYYAASTSSRPIQRRTPRPTFASTSMQPCRC